MKELDKIEMTKPNLNIESISQDHLERYIREESEWIDDVFTHNWPKIFPAFAQWINNRITKGKKINFIHRALIFFMARLSGFGINRNQHLNVLGGKVFRPGHSKTVVDRVTVTVTKKGKEVAKRDFKLSIY